MADRMVLLSLHQPSAAGFALLDTVLLLTGGRAVFFGPATAAGTHLAAAGLPVPPGALRNTSTNKVQDLNVGLLFVRCFAHTKHLNDVSKSTNPSLNSSHLQDLPLFDKFY